MAWVEVEEDCERWQLTAGVVGLAAGAVVWWYRDFCAGLLACLAVGLGIASARQLWLQVRLPREARQAANLVAFWFREKFPDEPVKNVAVRAIEPGRYVISIWHVRPGIFASPTPRSYFAIARPALAEIAELPESEWRPRGLK